jgi:exopolysaccharide production protein ExoQ
MGFTLAFIICAIGVAGLFYLDRDKHAGTARALWLPVIWFWIIGSRPVSAWLNIWFGIGSGTSYGLDAQLDGSPTDAAIFLLLLIAGIVVLVQRGGKSASLLKACTPVVIYFLYCLVSCLWSPFPDVAVKRWIKDLGDLVMVLVVATDPRPVTALRQLFSRVGFVLLPASVLLIRYSPLGRSYDASGTPGNTGVTTNKNELGLIAFVIALGAVWSCLSLLRSKRGRTRRRQLIARLTLVAFGAFVLQEAHSVTSTVCFGLGTFLMLVTNLRYFRLHPPRVHALVLTILLLGGVTMLFGGGATVVGAMGKDPTLSDRTKIWAAVIPVCPNPLIGAGFESFWNGYGKYVEGSLSKYERGLNSAHDGYIEIYLNLGWVGVAFIAMLLVSAHRRAAAAFRRNPEVGGLMLAYVSTVALYGITEAGFRILTPSWLSLLLVLVGSRSIASSVNVEFGKTRRNVINQDITTSTARELSPAS